MTCHPQMGFIHSRTSFWAFHLIWGLSPLQDVVQMDKEPGDQQVIFGAQSWNLFHTKGPHFINTTSPEKWNNRNTDGTI